MFDASPTLVFSAGTSWFQILVKLVTLSEVDHVSLGLGDQILHARDRGVVLEPRAEWLANNRIVAEFAFVPDVSRGIMRCLGYIGQPYDRPGILRIGLGLALRRSFSFLRPWPADNAMHTCAAFVMLVDPHGAQIPEWQAIARRDVVPTDLYHAIGPSFQKVQPLRAL